MSVPTFSSCRCLGFRHKAGETTSKEEMISQVAMNGLIYAELNSMRVQITRHSDLLVTKDTEIETLKATILSMQAQQLSMQTKQREQADLIAAHIPYRYELQVNYKQNKELNN